MKSVYTVMTILACSFMTQAKAETIAAGTIIKIPSITWVRVEQPISSGNVDFKKGDTCSIQRGARMHVISINGDQSQALMGYEYPEQAFGAPCPGRAVFILPMSDLEKAEAASHKWL